MEDWSFAGVEFQLFEIEYVRNKVLNFMRGEKNELDQGDKS